MKKALIIALLFILPLQAMAAVERNLVHLFGQAGNAPALVGKHVSEHISYTLHHHDEHGVSDPDGGDAHTDGSVKSFKHLAEHGGGMHVLMPAVADFSIGFAPRIAPAFRLKSFTGRTTIPPLRPPRAHA